jgi:hypothetical protein
MALGSSCVVLSDRLMAIIYMEVVVACYLHGATEEDNCKLQ